MLHEHKSLEEEMPEFTAEIEKLRKENTHFEKLYTKLEKLDNEIHRHEADIEPISDEHMEDLKKDRLKIKDEMHNMLVAIKGGGSCCGGHCH